MSRITRPDGSRAEEAKITLSDKVLTAKGQRETAR